MGSKQVWVRIRFNVHWVPFVILVWLALFLNTALPALARQNRSDLLVNADRKYAQQSFAQALKIYESLQSAGQIPDMRKDEIGFRIVVALGKTHQWDRALSECRIYIKNHRGTLWEPRALYWLARLYGDVPSNGYRVGTRIYRGDSVPTGVPVAVVPASAAPALQKLQPDTPRAEKPVAVDLRQQDVRNRLDALEAAHLLFDRVASNPSLPISPALKPGIDSERIQLDADLIQDLISSDTFTRWAMQMKWLPPSDASWRIDDATTYNREWPIPKKVLSLYRHIGNLSPTSSTNLRTVAHRQAVCLLHEAFWLDNYQIGMASRAYRLEKGKRVAVPYPYQDLKPEDYFKEILKRFSTDPIVEQVAYFRATRMRQSDRPTEALLAYQTLCKLHPQSSWARLARHEMARLLEADVQISMPDALTPAGGRRLDIGYRNTRNVHLEVFRVDLPRLLQRPERTGEKLDARAVESPDTFSDWNEITSAICDPKSRRALAAAGNVQRVASWDRQTTDRRDLKPHHDLIGLPFHARGTYVVVASVPGKRAALSVPITDLALVQKRTLSEDLYYVTDLASGKPVSNAHLLLRQSWRHFYTRRDGTGGRRFGVSFVRGSTNPDGLLSVPHKAVVGHEIYAQAAVAWIGDRAAFMDAGNSQDHSEGSTAEAAATRIYGTTDRTVYRPEQVVHFRELVLQRTGTDIRATDRRRGEFLPLKGRTVRVVVTDPQGNTVYKQRSLCNAFGSVSGAFSLKPRAPLGEYTISVSLPQNKSSRRLAVETDEDLNSAGNRFRVEEYKKPEYEVTVTPTAQRVQLGQPTSVKIHAAYYFGGPVPGASVTYRVYRSDHYRPTYRFPQPYDYLYRDQNQGEYDTEYRRNPVVSQGKTHLDARGDATVTFPTEPDNPVTHDNDRNSDQNSDQNSDRSYTVEADVQDASRRVISGSGTLKATRHDVAVFLNFPHGYATQGDRVDVEIKTLNASDQPVAATGTARVYRQPNDPKGKETLIYSAPASTDAQGYGMIRWKATTSGHFRIAFETSDKQAMAKDPNQGSVRGSVKDLVKGDILVWVDGPELRGQRFVFQGVTLTAQNPYYQEGQTAHLLLVTPEPDCSVLLTREAEGHILDKRLVRVPGRSLLVAVPITRRDVPNVFVSALMVRHGETSVADQELFVPPVRQTVQVTVRPDKLRYAPGEKAHLLLEARDFKGRPVRTELSLAITDAALNYIQKDYAPDIRAYFYGDRRTQDIALNFSSQLPPSPYLDDLTYHAPLGDLTFPKIDPFPFAREGLSLGHAVGFGSSVSGAMRGGMRGGGPGGAGFGEMIDRDAVQHVNIGLMMKLPRSISQRVLDSPLAHMTRSTLEAPARIETDPVRAYKRDIDPVVIPEPKSIARGGELAPAIIRSDFRDTAFWTPSVVTNGQGRASLVVVWPDNLTQWRAHALGNTQEAQVGVGESNVTIKKDLLVQLESPRFVVERDVVTLSAVVHNDTDHAARIRVKLDLDNADVVAEDIAGGALGVGRLALGVGNRDGYLLAGSYDRAMDTWKSRCQLPNASTPNAQRLLPAQRPTPQRLHAKSSETWIDLPKGAQQRVDWLVRPQHAGVMHARMAAQSATDADASQTIIPVLAHGAERSVVQSGAVKNSAPHRIALSLPDVAQRKPGSSYVRVTLNPSLAGVMLDALPYLADYPYGCVEQTMSRFLPSVLVARALKSTGYNLKDLERATRLRREAAAKRDPKTAYLPSVKGGKDPNLAGFPAEGNRILKNPVWDEKVLHRMVAEGMARLKEFQHDDGGWGWWKEDASDPYMSTYVLCGLLTCKEAGMEVSAKMLERGLKYVTADYLKQTDLHQMTCEARVLARVPAQRPIISKRLTQRIYPQREKLSVYGKALLALALNETGSNVEFNLNNLAKTVLDNIENTAHVDEANGTANWGDGDGFWWRWYNNKIETNATVLEAYSAIAPNAHLPELLVKWLVNNRRGAEWNDTHDTALAVNALADWVRGHHELAPNYTVTLNYGNRLVRTFHVTHENAIWFDNTFIVPDSYLTSGDQTLTITKSGAGTCYYTAVSSSFSLEEPIPATSNEIAVIRRYFRLTPAEIKPIPTNTLNTPNAPTPNAQRPTPHPNPFLTGQYDLLDQGDIVVEEEDTVQGPTYARQELKGEELIESGDLLEVELDLEAKNDYDYVLFEDRKPAGCEPVELRSGEHAGLGIASNMELRDDRVAFFLTHMRQGKSLLSYRLRAEIPGFFHILPTSGYAMYAPDVHALSDEQRLGIRDEEKINP